MILPDYKIADITDPEIYYTPIHGSKVVVKVFDGGYNILAESTGISFGHNFQSQDYKPMGAKKVKKIVMGAMNAGQFTLQAAMCFGILDNLPVTHRTLPSIKELQAITMIADHEDANMNGIVLHAFKGMQLMGINGNAGEQSMGTYSLQFKYTSFVTGLQYKAEHTGAKYPAEAGAEKTLIIKTQGHN